MDIVHATKADRQGIVQFIKEYWNQNHILVKSEAVFNHLYANQHNDCLQFFLCKDQNQRIRGLLGYILDDQFRTNPLGGGCWLALWKSDPTLNSPIGLKLLLCLKERLEVTYIACLGINPETVPFYEALGFETGVIPHYFKDTENSQLSHFSNYKFERVSLNETQCDFFAIEDIDYFRRKYWNSGFYNYTAFLTSSKCGSKALIVTTKYENKNLGRPLVRILDFIGDVKAVVAFCHLFCGQSNLKNSIRIGMHLWQSDEQDDSLSSLEVSTTENPCPTFLEPLVNSHVDRYFCFKEMRNRSRPINITSGSGDQFRPNQLIQAGN